MREVKNLQVLSSAPKKLSEQSTVVMLIFRRE